MRKSQLIGFREKRSYFLLLAATTLCIFIPSQILYQRTTNVLKENVRTRALSIAATIATFLEDDITTYRTIVEASDIDSDAQINADYQRYNALLRTIKEQSGAEFVYTETRVDENTIRYVLDAGPSDSEFSSPFGSLDSMDETEKRTYATRMAVASTDLVASDWGTLFSAFAPIIDKRDGSLAGLVGVDYSAAILLQQSRRLLYIHISTFSMLSLLLSFALFVVIQMISTHAYTDELTSLGNRRALSKALIRLERDARSYQRPFSLITLDVDTFKLINDEHGHPIGDKVLKRIADTLVQYSVWEDGCFRSGGDEFALLLPSTDLQTAEQIKHRIKADIQAIFLPELKGASLSVSIGIAMWHDGDSLQELIKRSDESLYTMKKDRSTRKKG